MTGKGEVLKAHSAMASITSWKISNITVNQGGSSANEFIWTSKVIAVNKYQSPGTLMRLKTLKPPKFYEFLYEYHLRV